MFARLLALLASLSLVVNLSSAANLRQDASAVTPPKAIPTDHKAAEVAFHSFMRDAAVRTSNGKKSAEMLFAPVHAEVRKRMDEMDKKGKVAALAGNNDSVGKVRHGAFIQRSRPNSDCTGVVTTALAYEMGNYCYHNEGSIHWYTLSCTPTDADGNVPLFAHVFDAPGCKERDYVYDLDLYPLDAKCEYDFYGIGSTNGPAMLSTQCTHKSMDMTIEKGGIAFVSFDEADTTCENDPIVASVQQYGGCLLVSPGKDHITDKTRFHYMSIDSCEPATGAAHITAYSDAACTRPLYHGSFNVAPAGEYGQCVYNAYNVSNDVVMCVPANM